ncbi:hypothetical protein OIDMADRAFT_16712 [Oidiodendron maius Zn]|uniref:Uncharacterized protein n=1 Tax=Oidiodendron maius (strain Zn) TaxID=913774 RepID=A0A0C3I2K1_OIDMZ|nr:hypothetical protein OIDMADRAFT_16712 [Oidiodendron maius Zn]
MATTLTSNSDVTYMTSLGLKSNLESSLEDGLFFYQRGLGETNGKAPILMLCHGYPET